MPGTELRRNAKALKVEFDPEPPYSIRSHNSMTEEDIAYGLKVAEAVRRVGDAWTVRLLGREAGVTFADVIDAWIEWTAGEPAGSPIHEEAKDQAKLDESIRQFIPHFCARKRIPQKFYEASSAIEFRERAKGNAVRP